MNIDRVLLETAQRMEAKGGSDEEILAAMKAVEPSPLEAMKALVALRGMSLTTARQLVENSSTWAEEYATRREAIDEILDQMSD